MDAVHGVDVSWLHHPNKDHHHRKQAPSSPGLTRDAPPPTSSRGGLPPPSGDAAHAPQPGNESIMAADLPKLNDAKPPPSAPQAAASEPTLSPAKPASAPRRPGMLGRTSSEKVPTESGTKSPRRGSFFSKFSTTAGQQAQNAPQPSQSSASSSPQIPRSEFGPTPSPATSKKEPEELQPYVPQKPRESTGSFFSSLTRRLSSGSQIGGVGRAVENGGVCARRVMNRDPNRERCAVPELDAHRLRRVSFSVDVEIAAGPKYKEEEIAANNQKKGPSNKMKERAEGEALKNPQAVADVKEAKDEKRGPAKLDGSSGDIDEKIAASKKTGDDMDARKKPTEEPRKDRKENKRKQAEESGMIPVEVSNEADRVAPAPFTSGSSPVPLSASGTTKPQDRPTTDPVRIYRRCCQLRESPILKRITEQLMSPACINPSDPGIVTCLNLTGSRLQTTDFVTLGDWLAVVPVKRLLLEDADMTDEGLRVVLAGLLAAKKPEPTRARKNGDSPSKHYQERSGIVEKLMLKNNPRISQVGWKHIALFINMCRSIKAIDLSMIQFPDTIPPSATSMPVKAPGNGPTTSGQPADAAEIFSKALSGRLGGSRLEELIMSECGLSTPQLRSVLDGATASGVTRVGVAGNRIDDEGFEHVLQYVRSGVCMAVDIGSNDLSGKLGRLGDALLHNPESRVWGLSLAFCNLDAFSLKPLCAALAKLPDLRFLDLSHNRHLFEGDKYGGVQLLRKYLPSFTTLKRLHLVDVGMSLSQAIYLSEVLPEAPALAHLNILENAELSTLANATDERSHEDACALYASLVAAVRVSSTIVCVDVDVPGPNSNEVVKALAKQVVAYCLRNMERLTLEDVGASAAVTEMLRTHEENKEPQFSVPDVLMHLVGHVDGYPENHDKDDPAPDDDYIVGGTGVVKALQYFLGQEGSDSRRGSANPPSGVATPVEAEGTSNASGGGGRSQGGKGKAKEVSKNLLDSARKIRGRLQPALVKESTAGDELAYRRLLFLDQTLHGMIQRFEDEYPETRIAGSTTDDNKPPSFTSSEQTGTATSFRASGLPGSSPSTNTSVSTDASQLSPNDWDNEETHIRPPTPRHNSDVNLASRTMSLEEGRLHRVGQKARRSIIELPSQHSGGGAFDVNPSQPTTAVDNNPATASSASPFHSSSASTTAAESAGSAAPTTSAAARLNPATNPPTTIPPSVDSKLDAFARQLEGLSGPDLKRELEQGGGWDGLLERLGASYEEMRRIQANDPLAWEQFKESQVKARANMVVHR